MSPNQERFPGFDECLQMMHRHNPQVQEDGFGWLSRRAREFLPELIEAFQAETDHGLRCWLLELIGDARSEDALDVLATQLGSADESLRYWAVRGLAGLRTKRARTILWEAQARQLPSEDETEEFRKAIRDALGEPR